MAISVEHDVPLMAPNVLNDGDPGVPGCAEAPFGDVALIHTKCTLGRTEGAGHLFVRICDGTERKIEIIPSPSMILTDGDATD